MKTDTDIRGRYAVLKWLQQTRLCFDCTAYRECAAVQKRKSCLKFEPKYNEDEAGNGK